jgi:uncharacterized protein YjiS (DUF1127 family)
MGCGSATSSSNDLARSGLPARPRVRWISALRRMHDRWRQRQGMLYLDERLLRDIGMTRAQAIEEARKPFWE